MGQRINYTRQSPDLTRKLYELGQLVKESGLEVRLLDLVNICAARPRQVRPALAGHRG
jgi:hypothetical protein